MSNQLPAYPVRSPGGRECPECLEGWTCEKHPGFKWPHLDENESDGQCPGPGMPCRNGCLGFSEEQP